MAIIVVVIITIVVAIIITVVVIIIIIVRHIRTLPRFTIGLRDWADAKMRTTTIQSKFLYNQNFLCR